MDSSAKLAGIEIGGTKLQLSVADASGKLLHSLRYDVAPNGGAEAIKKQILHGVTVTAER